MLDTNKVLMEFLLAQAPLTAVVSTNIYAVAFPTGKVPTTPMIVYHVSGGVPDESTPLLRPSIMFNCYHESDSIKARSAYRALHDVLHGIQNVFTASGVIVEAIEEIHGQDTFDPDTKWPFVFTSYRLIFHE